MIAYRAHSVRTLLPRADVRQSPGDPSIAFPHGWGEPRNRSPPMPPAVPHRPCRPLTIYGFRRRRAKARRAWVWALAFASVVAVPRVIHTGGDAPRLSRARDSDLHPRSQSVL